MVRFIFLHGVGNRESARRDHLVAQRNSNFQEFVFGPEVHPENPFWGQFGANPVGGVYKSLPDYDNPTADGVEHLNVGTPVVEVEAPALIDLARENFPETVDLILQAALEKGGLDAEEAEAARIVGAYALADPSPAWLVEDMTDAQFLRQLDQIAQQLAAQRAPAAAEPQTETLGVGSFLRNGAKALKDKISNAGGRLALSVGREFAHAHVAAFMGDIFAYLKEGAGREPIRDLLRASLAPAIASGEQIVLMGHSMGGVILVDCLGDAEFCASVGLIGGKKIDALITVGSQPGFFQELDLLTTKGAPSLPTVDNWINIYDELDVLSFRAAPLFTGQAKDMLFSSKTGLLQAHTAYFTRVQFYLRLHKRLKDIGIEVL